MFMRFWDDETKPKQSGYLLSFSIGDKVEVDTKDFGWLAGSVDNLVLGDKPIVIVAVAPKKRIFVMSESCIRKVGNDRK